jgi:hypothetical protein
MNKLILLCVFSISFVTIQAQKKTFDLASYIAPQGWKKQTTVSALQFSKENVTKGTYCTIILYKAIPGKTDPKENFTLAWETLIKEMVTISGDPEMQPTLTENGWTAESGFAPFETEGSKGMVVLVTSTSLEKMVNLVILTNSDSYQKEVAAFLESISLKKQIAVKKTIKPTEITNVNPTPVTSVKEGFAFTSTNFEDGWTSTVQENWVEVKKADIKVLIHYPREGTIFPADPDVLTNAAWNILVAPRYRNLKNYKTSYISTYDRPYLGMGNANETSTGKNVFIVLFRQGQTGWIEFVAPDKNAFIGQFNFDPETIKWDSETTLMNPLANLTTYNRFAIAASDFKGKWTSDFTGIQQMYHVYTGQYAGMNINQSNEEFVFKPGNTYNWKLLVINGMVGNAKFAEVKSSGKLTVSNNWQVKFSMIEDRARTYHAFWSCIKGARILNLLDADFPGSGIYTKYGLAK